MIAWLNELYKLTYREPSGLPWDSVAIIRREYQNLLDYTRYHYTLEMTEDGWIATRDRSIGVLPAWSAAVAT